MRDCENDEILGRIFTVEYILGVIFTVVQMFELIQNNVGWFFVVATLFSLFWGIHGVSYANKEDKKECGDFHDVVILIGYFISEFAGSFIGWVSLYVFSIRIADNPCNFGTVDLFLILGAFIGISGWAYRIFELIDIIVSKKSGSE